VACQLKEREPAMQALAKRVAARESAGKQAPGVVGGSAATKSSSRATAVLDPPDEAGLYLDDEPSPAKPRCADQAGCQPQAQRRPGQPGSAKKPPQKRKRR